MPKGRVLATGVSWNNMAGRLSKVCPSCRRDLPRSKDFWGPSKLSSDGLSQGWCRKCITAYSKNKNKEARVNALIHYSNGSPQCACCGDFRFEFLALDHISGGGNAHRQKVTGSKRGAIYQWLEKNHYPVGYQVLCHNCDMAKHIYGSCPYATSHVWPRTTRKVS